MATLVKTPSRTWKAVIRKNGWPTTSKTFRTKRDAEDWSRRTEDEMVRGVYIERSSSERMTLEKALNRYLAEVSPTKAPKTAKSEAGSAKVLISRLGKYSLAALSADILADYRDSRLAERSRRKTLVSPNTVRLELALLSHLFTVAIQELNQLIQHTQKFADERSARPRQQQHSNCNQKADQSGHSA